MIKDTSYEAQWLGQVAYQKALDLQTELQLKIKQGHPPVILGLEHPKVITLGIRAQQGIDLLETPENLKAKDFTIFNIRRGGEATLHNPGQLVIYPLIPLKKWGLGVKQYVNLLEDTTKVFFKNLGIETVKHNNNPGLYTTKGKIAFFGVRIKNGITSHGISINVKNDLKDFSFIRSCGTNNESFDQTNNYVTDSQEQLFTAWKNTFLKVIENYLVTDSK